MTFSFEPGAPKDAYAFWKDKVPMSKKAFTALSEDDRVKAFVVAGMAKGDMLQAMYDSIGNALATGQSKQAWKDELRQLFKEKGWTQLNGFRLDNIFRTNIQTAYTAGRYRQMMEVVKARPYWRYSAINDKYTRLTHSALHGRVVRADDPFWDTFYPPNGYRCRCTVSSLSERDMERKGYRAETIVPGQVLEIKNVPKGYPKKDMAVPVMPDKDFGSNPAKSYWKADTGRFRADVKQAVLKDLPRACPEEFADRCEFAETDCFKRLKRHLTTGDAKDLQTVVWAGAEEAKKTYGDWAADVVKSGKGTGAVHPAGNLPGKVLSGLKSQPRLAVVALEDSQLAALADTPALAKAAGQIPERMAQVDWFLDPANPEVLVAWIQEKGQWIRMEVTLDAEVGRDRMIMNQMRLAATAGQELDDTYQKITPGGRGMGKDE